MTLAEYTDFILTVSQLWPGFAKREWTDELQGVVFQFVQSYAIDDALSELRRQRFHDPDAAKPNWGSLRAELKALVRKVADPAETEHRRTVERERSELASWSKSMTAGDLDALEAGFRADVAIAEWLLSVARKWPGRTWLLYQYAHHGQRFERAARLLQGKRLGPVDRQGVLGYMEARDPQRKKGAKS